MANLEKIARNSFGKCAYDIPKISLTILKNEIFTDEKSVTEKKNTLFKFSCNLRWLTFVFYFSIRFANWITSTNVVEKKNTNLPCGFFFFKTREKKKNRKITSYLPIILVDRQFRMWLHEKKKNQPPLPTFNFFW